MDKNNLRRVKNILDGNFTGKTLTSVGYKKSEEQHVEGDFWEDGGRTWTIKNGIKRNVTKLDSVRKAVQTPLSCPSCGNIMRKHIDKKMWRLRSKCLDCVVIEDTERIKNNTFDQYEKEVVGSNMETYLDQVSDFLDDYVDKLDSKHFVTEQGDIEEWQSGFSKEQLKTIFDKQIKGFKHKIKEYKNSRNDNDR